MERNNLRTLLPTNSLLQEIIKFEAVKKMRATVHSATKTAAIVGASTLFSGLLGGPRGAALGGVVSSCLAGYFTQDTYKSIPDILMHDTTPEEREKLADALREYLLKIPITNIHNFTRIVLNNETLMQGVMQILLLFLTNQLHLSIVET